MTTQRERYDSMTPGQKEKVQKMRKEGRKKELCIVFAWILCISYAGAGYFFKAATQNSWFVIIFSCLGIFSMLFLALIDTTKQNWIKKLFTRVFLELALLISLFYYCTSFIS